MHFSCFKDQLTLRTQSNIFLPALTWFSGVCIFADRALKMFGLVLLFFFYERIFSAGRLSKNAHIPDLRVGSSRVKGGGLRQGGFSLYFMGEQWGHL